MDLALAGTVNAALVKNGTKLDATQFQQLTLSARQAKEQILADAKLATAAVTVLGKGRSLIGGTIRHDLQRAEVETVLVNGFFPECPRDAEPARARAVGLQELGLPYVSDPAVTKHLAHFLTRQAEALAHRDKPAGKKGKKADGGLPTAVLFNGGVFKATPLRGRFMDVLGSWAKAAKADPPRDLAGADLDQAVARGAAYYGLVRRGKGVRIRGGTARAYYIGVETAQPAIPGMPPPLKALCVAPFGMEEGTETDVPMSAIGLIVGEEVEFRFLGSSVRRDDKPGEMIEEWDGQIDELAPLRVTLDGKPSTGRVVPVTLHSRVTEVGLLELWCHSRDGKQKWKLEFNVREQK
jgi:hypothetical protein